MVALLFLFSPSSGKSTADVGHVGILVPSGCRAAPGAGAEPYTNTGWAKEIVHGKTGIEMVFIPAGRFIMGSPEGEPGRQGDEGPLHSVHITRPFYLAKYEVTNAQFRRFRPRHTSARYRELPLDEAKQPAVRVSWLDANDFCRWARLRLPTEAEWEYACRAGTRSRYWWGDDEAEAGRHANVADRSFAATHPGVRTFDTDDGHVAAAPVGTYDSNAWGLYDMIGNVWEFCADRYDALYYSTSPEKDPECTLPGRYCVVRGGSWRSNPQYGRCAFRNKSAQTYPHDPDLGFRVAMGL